MSAEFFEHTLKNYWTSQTPAWRPTLLVWSLWRFVALMRSTKLFCPTQETLRIVKSALCSPLIYSHRVFWHSRWRGTYFGYRYKWFLRKTSAYARANGCLDLVVAMRFDFGEYVTLCQSLTSMPSREACTWTVNLALEALSGVRMHTDDHWNAVCQVLQISGPQILAINLHLLFYAIENHWDYMWRTPTGKLFSRTLASFLQHCDASKLSSEANTLYEPFGFDGRPAGTPLAAITLRRWISIILKKDYTSRIISDNGNLSDVFTNLLRLILCVSDVNDDCEGYHCIFHFTFKRLSPLSLVGRLEIVASREGDRYKGHSFLRGGNKSWLHILITLATLGAVPSEHGSLPVLLDHLRRIRKSWIPSKNAPSDPFTLEPVCQILEHYQQQGSWPDFEPYVEEHNFSRKFFDDVRRIGIESRLSKSKQATGHSTTDLGATPANLSRDEAEDAAASMSGALPIDPSANQQLVVRQGQAEPDSDTTGSREIQSSAHSDGSSIIADSVTEEEWFDAKDSQQ